MSLIDYVLSHTYRGECQCGKCVDSRGIYQPEGPHTVDMVFFKVAPINEPNKDEFVRLSKAHHGEYAPDTDPFDGKKHDFMRLGAWIGDQGVAMQYMALGVSLGLFSLFTPEHLGFKGEQALEMAGNGFLAIQANPVPAEAVNV